MKILIFVRKFNDSTHTFIYNELQGLLARGHQLKVLCTQRMYEDKYPFSDVEVSNISVLERFMANRFHGLGWKLHYKNKPLARSVKRVVNEFQPDIIHCHFGPDALYFLDNYTAAQSAPPLFIHFHGFDASIMLRDKLYCQRLSEVFSRPYVHPVFVSNFMKKNVEAKAIPIPRFHILYYGTNTNLFCPDERLDRLADMPIRFLQVSSLREKKGHIYTLEALARWSKQYPGQRWLFKLTGDGPERARLEALAEELDIRENLHFVGFVDVKQAKELMNEADLFLHHSVTGSKDGDMEGIPNAVMEAMAMELPVLSTYHSGIPELIEDGVHGYLVEERDVETYAKRLADISNWPLLKRNRARVQELFEQQKHAEILESYYLEAINN